MCRGAKVSFIAPLYENLSQKKSPSKDELFLFKTKI